MKPQNAQNHIKKVKPVKRSTTRKIGMGCIPAGEP
jgi:hypothetical protein